MRLSEMFPNRFLRGQDMTTPLLIVIRGVELVKVRAGRVPARHRMPAAVADALHRLFRDAVHWLTDGRYAASVRGSYHWRVKVVRV